MREHQIVITLKPEQFLEVQRLARAANAKSMGIFVRQKLLAALGIEGSLQVDQQQSKADLEPVVGQMKRLHSELKMFVAESLSIYNQEFDVSVVMETPADIEQNIPLDSTGTGDELERVAERTFAISPRLGAIAPADEELVRLRESVPPGLLNHKTNELYGRHELHRRDTHRYLHQRAASEVLDTPFSNVDATFDLEPRFVSTPADSGGEPTVSGLDPYYDEDSSPKPPVRDPLDQLLPEAGSAKSNKSRRAIAEQNEMAEESLDDDDLFDVPPSIAERRRQLAEEMSSDSNDSTNMALNDESAFTEVAAYAVSSPTVGVEAGEFFAQSISNHEPNSAARTGQTQAQVELESVDDDNYEDDDEPKNHHASDVGVSSSTRDTMETLPVIAENDNTSASSTASSNSQRDDSDEDELRAGTARPLGYPPFSGSPPPKRRQV